MLQYRFDEQANRIYLEAPDGKNAPEIANRLHELLPQTRPGFTLLVDLSDLSPSDIPTLILPDDQVLFVDYGIKRCAFLSPDTHVLLELNKQLRKLPFKIEHGYFTRRDDAVQFLIAEPVEVV